MMKKYIVFCLIALSLFGCSSSKKSDKQIITVSIEPLRYFTEQIVGDHFSVNTMVPKGGNPETYEPTSQQMIRLSNSVLFIKVGNIGFERTWMKKLSQNAPNTIIMDSSKGITPAVSNRGNIDPHTWMSTTSATVIAKNICDALVKIDPKNSNVYKQNLDKLLKSIQETDKVVRQELAKKHATSFLIYHPALTYFARDYGLMQIPVEEEGHEPSAAQLENTIKLSKQNHVKVMFIQKEFISRNTQIVSQGVGAESIEINPLSDNWHAEMIGIAQKLK